VQVRDCQTYFKVGLETVFLKYFQYTPTSGFTKGRDSIQQIISLLEPIVDTIFLTLKEYDESY
jgi:hypothetical protein